MSGTCSHGRRLCAACLLQTALFPVEHVVWERLLLPLAALAGLEVSL